MGRVDEAAQPVGPAVDGVRRPGRRRRSPSCASPGKVGHRHQLDGGDAELAQRAAGARRPPRRSPRGEGADVELVDDQARPGRGRAQPPSVQANAPGSTTARRPAHALRLEARAGVGQRVAPVQDVAVARRRGRGRHAAPRRRPGSAARARRAAPVRAPPRRARARRPHAEDRRAVPRGRRAERRSHGSRAARSLIRRQPDHSRAGAASARREAGSPPQGTPRRVTPPRLPRFAPP